MDDNLNTDENLFSGFNFDQDKYLKKALKNTPLDYSNKEQNLSQLKDIIKETEKKYNKSSEKFIDVLLNNYQIFISIGKYVEKIDKSVEIAINAEKECASLMKELKKDIEDFSFSKNMMKTDRMNLNTEMPIFPSSSEKILSYKFEPIDEIEDLEQNFDLQEFLNPKEGGKKWLEQSIENVRVLAEEKKFDECVELINKIKKCDRSVLENKVKYELDETYNYLIEKLTLALSKSYSLKEMKTYLQKLEMLGCKYLAVDSFLSWLSNKLRTKIQKQISNEEDFDFMDEKNENLSKTIKRLSNQRINTKINKKLSTEHNLNVIKEEGDESEVSSDLSDDTEKEEKKKENNKEKNTVEMEDITNLIVNSECKTHDKIIEIITSFFSTLERAIKLIEDYFKIPKNMIYPIFFIPFLKQEMNNLNTMLENLFSKVRTIYEFNMIITFISSILYHMESKGESGRFIYEFYFINNLKIALEAIANYCLRVNISGIPFDLKKYDIPFKESKLPIFCVTELGPGIFNITFLISEFTAKYMESKHKLHGINYIEEFLYENVLNEMFIGFIKEKINKAISSNYDVKPFTNNIESLAPSNQILLNYGITILSLEKVFMEFKIKFSQLKLLNSINAPNIDKFLNLLNEEKNTFFINFLKVKIENYFYKFFDIEKENLKSDSTNEFSSPHLTFLSYYSMLKTIANLIKTKLNDYQYTNDFIEYFTFNAQYLNFLSVIGSIRCLNEVYETDFNLSKMGKIGIDILIYGILYIYYKIRIDFNFDIKSIILEKTRNVLIELIINWGKSSNHKYEQMVKEIPIYEQKTVNYINSHKE